MASPIEQLLQNVQPKIRPLARMDIQNYAKGGQKLSNLEFNTAQKAIISGKPVIKKNENHGILHDLVSLPGNIAKDATSTAMGFFSPWKWVPSIWHNVETGNVNGLLPLIPGYTTAKNLMSGDFHDILTHPVGTTLDVLPYAHELLPRVGYGLAGENGLSEAGKAARSAIEEVKPEPKFPVSELPKKEPGEITVYHGENPNETYGNERWFTKSRSYAEKQAGPEGKVYARNILPDVFNHLEERSGVENTGAPLSVLHTNAALEHGPIGAGKGFEITDVKTPEKLPQAPPRKGSILHESLGIRPSTEEVQGAYGLRSDLTPRQTRIAAAMAEGKPGRTIFNILPERISSPDEGFLGRRLEDIKTRSAVSRAMGQANRGFIHTVDKEYIQPLQDIFKDYNMSERKGFVEWWEHYNDKTPNSWTDAAGTTHMVPEKFQADFPKVQEVLKKLEKEANTNLQSVWWHGRQYLYHEDSPVIKAQADIAKQEAKVQAARSVADNARDEYIAHQMEDIQPEKPASVQREIAPGSRATFAADEAGNVEPREPFPAEHAPIKRKSYQLFRTKDAIAQTEKDLDAAMFRRSQIDNRTDPKWMQENERVGRLQNRLQKLQARHDLLSKREVVVNNLSKNPNYHLSPEDYDILGVKQPGEVAPAKAYRKALEKLDQRKADLAAARDLYDKTLARNAPATFYPAIHDAVLQRIVEKFKANHPDFPEGKTGFDPNLTYAALDQQTLGRDPIQAGLTTPKEVRQLTKEVESTWQQMADDGFNPQYMSNVPEGRYGSVLDPNVFRPGAAKDVPYSVRARTHDLTPSGIKDPVVGLTAPAMALLRRDSLREFYNTFLAPSLKSESDLDAWLDREITNSQFEPSKAGESFAGRREAIKKSRWANFDLENIDPELAQFFPKGEKVYAPKEVYDSITQLFSPKGQNRLESLSQANIHGMRVFRTAVMGMSVKHLAHILFGGMAMLLMRGKLDEISPDMMRAAWHMVKDDAMPKELNAGVDFYSGRQVAAGITPEAERASLASKIGSKVSGAFAGIQTFEERIANFERSLSYLSELDRLLKGKGSPHLSEIENGEVRAALERGDKEHAVELAKRGAIKHANKALIDFDGMLPAERGIVRNIFPFYAFTRHIFKYAFTYPIDYPLRAAFVYRLGEIVQKQMQDEGLPEQWMRYLTFGPDPEGNVTNVDLRFLNPFRSLPEDASGSGLVNTLNPFLGYALEWAGVNPWTTSAERYPDIRYNPETGYVETKRKPFSLLGLVSQIVPEAGFLEHVAGGVDSRQPVHNLIPHYAFLPGWPYKANINLQRAQDTLGQLEEAQSVVTNALKSGDTSDLKSYNLVPVPGYDKLIPGKLLAKVIDSLPNNGQTPRRQLGIR